MQLKLVDYDFNTDVSVFTKILNKSPNMWMENKRKADNAEGLWRIHNSLYDLTDFINVHPGGRFWLEDTKGMDVTEFFESHHVKSDKPEKMLKSFYIRKAKDDRLAKYTFDDNGFYRTLKRRVRKVLETIPEKDLHSHFYMDTLAASTVVLACLANYFSSYILAIIVGVLATFSVIGAHNYLHMKDSWRMYYAEVFCVPIRFMRIVHVLSHHMYTNTIIDIQLNFSEPVGNVLPVSKNFFVKYLSWIFIPLICWPFFIHVVYIIRILEYWFTKNNQSDKEFMLPFVLPISMFLFGRQSVYSTFLIWQLILLVEGFVFGILAFTTNHIHPDIYVDGDLTRPKEELDWGISQLDTTQDRHIVTGNKFLVLVTFGDHALHHLFPTIDHSALHHLYPVVEETLKEFNINSIRITTQTDLFLGFFKRLKNELPNINPLSLGYIKKKQ